MTKKQFFLRWLKNNNLFPLFRRNAFKYPLATYPLDQWLRHWNSENYSFDHLINIAPFPFGGDKEPAHFNIKTLKGNERWSDIGRELRYVKFNCKLKYYNYGK